MTAVLSSDLYLLLGGAIGPLARRWLARKPLASRDTVGDILAGSLCTVLAVAFGFIPDAIRAVLTVDPIRPIAFAFVASAGTVDLVKKGLGRYGMRWGESTTPIILAACLLVATSAVAVDRGAQWTAGGITPQQNGANFAVLPASDTLTYIYTRNPTTPTQLRLFRSPDSGQTVTLAEDAIVTGRATAYNPNAALQLATGQTLLSGYTPGTVGLVPEAPWLVGTGQVWTTPSVSGLPTIGPTAAPFPSPFSGGFLRAVATVASGTTLLSVVDNNSSNPPVICRSTTQGASFACASLPAGIATIRWRDPQSGSTSSPGTAQPLAAPTPTRWLLMDGDAQVFRSIDDGLTWTLLTRLTTDASVSWAITCLPPLTTCVAVTSSPTAEMVRLFRSLDSGDTWTAVYSVPRRDLVTALVAAGGNTVLALGDPSAVPPVLWGLQSQDGGTTWFPILSPRAALWAGVAPATVSAATTEYLTGFEEINERLTTWDGGTEPTGSLLTPRAVGPGRSIVSTGTIGSFLGLVRNTGLTCPTGCNFSVRWYTRLDSLVCTGNYNGAVLMVDVSGSGLAGGLAFQCLGGALVVPPRMALTPGATPTVVSTVPLTTGIWYRFELDYTFTPPAARRHTLSGFIEDTTVPFDTIGFTAGTGGAAPTATALGNTISSSFQLVWKFDDFGYRVDGTPLAGPAAIWTLAPTSDVSVQWSPATPGQFAHVDDVPGTPDDAADTVSAPTTGLVDRFGLTTPTGVPLGWNPSRAMVGFRAGAPGGGTPMLRARLWDSLGTALIGSTYTSGTAFASAITQRNYLGLLANGAETADIGDWNIGYDRTTGGSAGTPLMTAVWLNVELNPSPGSGGGGDSALGDGPSPFWQNQTPYVRADGSVALWTFWSNVLDATDTPSYLQAFTSIPTVPGPAAFPFPRTPSDSSYALDAGARIDIPRGDVAVTTAATAVLGGNQNRVRATCVNQGPDAVRIGDGTVTATRGVRVVPLRAFSTYSVATVYAIAELDAATVSCSEDLP